MNLEKKCNNYKNKQQGITLVALVITIAVMILLASVVVLALTNGGIIERTISAKEDYNISAEKEKLSILSSEYNLYKEKEEKNGVNSENIPTFDDYVNEKESNELKAFSINSEMYSEMYIVQFLETKNVYNLNLTDNQAGYVATAEKEIESLECSGSLIIIYNDAEMIGLYNISENGEVVSLGDGTTSEEYDETGTFAGRGTQAEPYEIKYIEDLIKYGIWLVNNSGTTNNYFKLMNDLDFKNAASYANVAKKYDSFGDINGNGIQDSIIVELITAKGFKPLGQSDKNIVRLDGNGKKINNLYINRPEEEVGLFAALGYWRQQTLFVKNLVMENVNIVGGTYAGAIFGYTKGITNIENCTIKGRIQGTENVGGIGAYAENGATIKNTHNEATIIGTAQSETGRTLRVSGICGGLSNVIVATDSSNRGTVQGSENVAGIAACGGTFKNCHNYGYIKGNINVVGISLTGKISENSHNEGKIEGTTYVSGMLKDGYQGYIIDSYNKGEIVGADYVAGLATFRISNITNSYNEGKITGANYVAGLVSGSSVTNNSYNLGKVEGTTYVTGLCYSGTTNDSYNKGEIVGAGNFVSGLNIVGVMNNCYNDGKVTGNEKVGGIIVEGYGGSVTNSYNKGEITGTNYVAGIAGFRGNITNCYNEGKIIGKLYVGGMTNGLSVESSYNKGEIKGEQCVGGLVGNTAIVNNSYNEGKVIGTVQSTGGITGSGGTLTNSYNKGEIVGVNCVGGLSGNGCNAICCYNEGKVTGRQYVAGICYFTSHQAKVRYSYNKGTIEGEDYVAGIVSKFYNSSPYFYCIYNIGGIVSQSTNKAGFDCIPFVYSNWKCNYYLNGADLVDRNAIPKTSAEMKSDDFISLEIDTSINNGYENESLGEGIVPFVKDINNINNGYPVLYWQNQQ